jgi:hypothetical protein
MKQGNFPSRVGFYAVLQVTEVKYIPEADDMTLSC